MGKKFWIIILLLVAGFAGIVWFGGKDTTQSQAIMADANKTTHIIGKRDAAVTLVEYSDFQCLACAAYYPIVEQIIEKYKDQISFEYRHYPLTVIHRNAFAAARASEAAGKQDKFWEMYLMLFENQSEWADSDNAQTIFEGYAKRLGLDTAKFKTDFASGETNGTVNAGVAEFNKRGLSKSTPTFLLNDKQVQPRDAEDFSKLIDAQLKAAAR
jgi:protein-disulfide isomerase